MIKIDSRAMTTPFGALDVGDTFLGGDNKYYIKIPTVTQGKNFEYFGTYNAVCITDGGLAIVVEEQPVTIVNIEGIVVL